MLKIQTGLSRKSETITALRFQFNLKTDSCWQYPAEMSAQKLKYLSNLLKNLPDTLPDCGDDSELEYDGLHPFNLDSHGSELESKSEIGEEVRSGMEILWRMMILAQQSHPKTTSSMLTTKWISTLQYCAKLLDKTQISC